VSAPLLELRDATIGVDGRALVRGVALTLEKGEVVAVLGANGVGKSSLLKTIAGDLDPLAGEVLLRGLPPNGRTARERARLVAVLPESEPLPYDFPAEAVVALGRFPHVGHFGRESDADLAAIARAVRIAGVEGLLARGINELSAGERQRVLLARALAQEPELILLDEPTAHLDPGRQVRVMTTLRELAVARQIAVVAVLHDPNLAARFADRVVLLGAERPLALGSPTTVLTAELLERTYGVRFRVLPHPDGGAPVVVVEGLSTGTGGPVPPSGGR
jgi:iron complex transport system ATP-binding protein